MASREYRPKEKNLHIAVCDYLRMQYPKAIFTSDMSGLRVNMGLAIQMKRQRSSNAIPDLLILEPRGGYSALLLELKRKDERVWLKDNSLTSNPNISEQAAMLEELNKRGYYATFACGFDEAKAIIDNYLDQ